jgi:nicotinamide mononucleotide adenylyltransferase
MASSGLTPGLTLWGTAVDTLNDIVFTTGKITKDNRRIWDGFLHSWDNTEWVLVLEAMWQLRREHPEFFTSSDRDALKQASEVLAKGIELGHTRVMDQSHKINDNKRKAWRILMTSREVWNRAQGTEIPFWD